MIDKSIPYFTVRVVQESSDPHNPKYLWFNFKNYEDAHHFATLACRSDDTIEANGYERCDSRKRIDRFSLYGAGYRIVTD